MARSMSGEEVHLYLDATGKAMLAKVLVSQNEFEYTPWFNMFDVNALPISTWGLFGTGSAV